MKLMLLALCATFITSQEESISPYEGMLQMNRCRVDKVFKTLRLSSCYSACVNGTNTFQWITRFQGQYILIEIRLVFSVRRLSNSEFYVTHCVGVISCGEKHDVFQNLFYIDKLQKLQNRVARVITRRSYDVSANHLLISLRQDNLAKRRKKLKATLTFKILIVLLRIICRTCFQSAPQNIMSGIQK